MSSKDPPAGVNLSDGITQIGGPEELALVGAAGLRSAANDDVELFFVNYFNPPMFEDAVLGEAFTAAKFGAQFADSVILPATPVWVAVPHEIGHVLLNPGPHATGDLAATRVMVAEAGSATYEVTGPKRFTVDEQDDMYSKRTSLLTNP